MAEQSFKLKNSQTGNYWQIKNGKRVYFNKDGKQIDEAIFLKSENAKINKDGKIQSNKIYIKGSTSGRYYTIENGVRHYYAANGVEIKESYFFEKEGIKKNAKNQLVKVTTNNNIQKKSAQNIAKNLKKATDGRNDNDAIKAEMAKVDNAEELQELEKQLAAAGYKADDMYSSVEKFLYKELSDSSTFDNSFDYLEELVQKWIQNGTLKGDAAIKAQARLAARIIRDGGDGMGTDCDEIKRGIHLIKNPKTTGNIAQDEANAKKVYQEVEKIIKNAHGETLEQYLDDEMWDGEVKYLRGIMAQNSAVQGQTKQQAITDLVIEAVNGAGTDVDALKEALKGIKSPEDRKAVNNMLQKYCKEKGINAQIKGQHALQAIMYDELDGFAGIGTNHEEIRKFNEMLISQGAYTKDEANTIRAEQAALQILEGDIDNIKDAVKNIKDKDVLKAVNTLLTTKGYQNLDDFLAKKGKTQEEKDITNGILASKKLLSDEKAAEVATRLLQNKDYDTRAIGVQAIRSTKVAQEVDKQLKANGSSLAKVMKQFNEEKEEYKTKAAIWDGLAYVIGEAEYISDQYRENTDMSDTLYLASEKTQEIPEDKKAAYNIAINKMEADLNSLKEQYQDALDNQGIVSGAVNYLESRFNIGTTRDDIEARIEHDEETVRLLKLAAEGKLTKLVDGKEVPVSFEEIFKERQSEFVTANAASISGAKNAINGKETTEFNADKVKNVADQGNKIAAMNIAKDYIADSWNELNNGIKTKDNNDLSAGIMSTLDKLSKMTGKECNLNNFGLKYENGNIVDASGNAASTEQLLNIANQLKTSLSEVSKALFNKDIPTNTNDISEFLEDGYEDQLEAFKEEYRAAFGQTATDEMIENYLTTVNTGTMVVNIGVAIGATILTAGYGSLAIFAAVGGTSAALNTLEHSTDANGLTNTELTTDLEQAAWDGALGAIGVKVGQYAESFATSAKVLGNRTKWVSKVTGLSEKNAEKVARCIARVEAAGREITSDTVQSLVQQFAMEGEIDVTDPNFIRAMLMSAGFNTVGHLKSGLRSNSKVNSQPDVDGNAPKTPKTGEYRAELTPVAKPEQAATKEFKNSMKQLQESIKSGNGNTIGELINTNPIFSLYKNQLEGLEDFRIVDLQSSPSNLGRHIGDKKEIALNMKALSKNDEAFVNTLIHEAEHAKQYKQYINAKQNPQLPENAEYIKQYEAMEKANNARARYYTKHKKVIDNFIENGKTKNLYEQRIVNEYKKLYNKYKDCQLEKNARVKGDSEQTAYKNKKEEILNGERSNNRTERVSEGDKTGHQDRPVGSDARDKSVEQGEQRADGTKETKVEQENVKPNAENNTSNDSPIYTVPKGGKEVASDIGNGITEINVFDKNGKIVKTVHKNKNNKVTEVIDLDKNGNPVKTTKFDSKERIKSTVEQTANGRIETSYNKGEPEKRKVIDTTNKTVTTEIKTDKGWETKKALKARISDGITKIRDIADYHKITKLIKKLPNKAERRELYQKAKDAVTNLFKNGNTRIKSLVKKTEIGPNGEQIIHTSRIHPKERTVIKTSNGEKTIEKFDKKGRLISREQVGKSFEEIEYKTKNKAVKTIKDSEGKTTGTENYVYNKELGTFVNTKPAKESTAKEAVFKDMDGNIVIKRKGTKDNYEYYKKNGNNFDKLDNNPFELKRTTQRKGNKETVRDENGQIVEKRYYDDENNVKSTSFYENGKLVRKTYKEDGKDITEFYNPKLSKSNPEKMEIRHQVSGESRLSETRYMDTKTGRAKTIDTMYNDGKTIHTRKEIFGKKEYVEIEYTREGKPSKLYTFKNNKKQVTYEYNAKTKQFEALDENKNIIGTAKYDKDNHTFKEFDKDGKEIKALKQTDNAEMKQARRKKIAEGAAATVVIGGVTAAGMYYMNTNNEQEASIPEVDTTIEPKEVKEEKPEDKKEEEKPEVKKGEEKPEVKDEESDDDKTKKETINLNIAAPPTPIDLIKAQTPPELDIKPLKIDPVKINPINVEPNTTPEEKPTIKNPINGRDEETGEKREIQSHERMTITQHIEQAKNEEDIKLIQEEMRSFKKFEGRRNLRRALRAKRKLLKKPESERRENRYEKRMEKIENSKVYQQDLIKTQYDYTEPPKDELDLGDDTFLA